MEGTQDGMVIRFAYLPAGTLGRLVFPSFTVYTLEPPWLDNRKNVSCIPVGNYSIHALADEKRGPVWWVKPVRDREGILIHVLNWVTETQGCIGVGLGFNIVDRMPSLLSSHDALELINSHLDRRFPHNLKVINTKAATLYPMLITLENLLMAKTVDVSKLKRIATVSLPPLSFKGRTVAFVKILSEMFQPAEEDSPETDRTPATTCRVVNLEDGAEYNLICPTVLVSELKKYSAGYVGKCFEISVTADKLPGKSYKGVSVYEVACPEA